MNHSVKNISQKDLLKLLKKITLLLGYYDVKLDEESFVINYTRPHSWIVPLQVQITILASENDCEMYFVFPNRQKLGLSAGSQTKKAKNELIDNIDKLHSKVDSLSEKDDEESINVVDKNESDKKSIEKEIIRNSQETQKKSSTKIKYFFAAVFLAIGLLYFVLLSSGHNYDSYQEFAEDTSELQEFQDIVDRFGNPDYEQNFSDYTYYTVFYNNITVKQRGQKKNVFWKVDRGTDFIIGSGLD